MRPPFLIALLAVAALYIASRTKSGQAAVESIAMSATQLLPRGIRNNNPGNLRYIARNPWDGQVGQDAQGFGVYASMAQGVRASARQLLKYQRTGLDTVRKIVSTWAPANENDTDAYVQRVARALGVAPDQKIDVGGVLEPLATEIFNHENGGLFTLVLGDIAKWVRS